MNPQQESTASSSNDSTAPAPNADQGQVLAAETQNAVTPPPSKPVTASAATVHSAHSDNNSDINTSPDPDDSKPVSVVTPPTEPISPPHPICHYPMLEPADVLPWCGNPPPPYPCHPMQPGTMIACPITYKAQ